MFSYPVDQDIELRLLEDRHAVELFALTHKNREYLRQWLGWVDYTQSVDGTRGFIQNSLRNFAQTGAFTAGIWYRGAIAGNVGLGTIDWHNRSTSLGYWLDADTQGRGVMTRAVRAVLDHLFRELGLDRVEIRCATGNTTSCAIPQRLGFTDEGIMRHAEWLYDHFVDHRVFSMLAEDWPPAI